MSACNGLYVTIITNDLVIKYGAKEEITSFLKAEIIKVLNEKDARYDSLLEKVISMANQ